MTRSIDYNRDVFTAQQAYRICRRLKTLRRRKNLRIIGVDQSEFNLFFLDVINLPEINPINCNVEIRIIHEEGYDINQNLQIGFRTPTPGPPNVERIESWRQGIITERIKSEDPNDWPVPVVKKEEIEANEEYWRWYYSRSNQFLSIKTENPWA